MYMFWQIKACKIFLHVYKSGFIHVVFLCYTSCMLKKRLLMKNTLANTRFWGKNMLYISHVYNSKTSNKLVIPTTTYIVNLQISDSFIDNIDKENILIYIYIYIYKNYILYFKILSIYMPHKVY